MNLVQKDNLPFSMHLTILITGLVLLGFLAVNLLTTKPRTGRTLFIGFYNNICLAVNSWQREFHSPKIRKERTPDGSKEERGFATLLTRCGSNLAAKLIQADPIRTQVEEQYCHGTWQRETYEDFRGTILAREHARTFPCLYATKGFRDNDHRYVFLLSEDPSEPRNIHVIGPALKAYLSLAHSLGSNTSLVIISQPSNKRQSLETYNESFWNLLRGLRICDQVDWPSHVPPNTSDPYWTFCFNGEPIFPIALTPAHERRWSRHASTLIVAIQPKWVIDNLMSTLKERQDATDKVRHLLRKYDRVEISPHLADYGASGASESRQLTLSDNDEVVNVTFDDMDS